MHKIELSNTKHPKYELDLMKITVFKKHWIMPFSQETGIKKWNIEDVLCWFCWETKKARTSWSVAEFSRFSILPIVHLANKNTSYYTSSMFYLYLTMCFICFTCKKSCKLFTISKNRCILVLKFHCYIPSVWLILTQCNVI